MKYISKTLLITMVLLVFASTVAATDLIITGVIDGPLTGGVPKAVEFYVLNDIADLSIYGFGSANNGGGSDGKEFTFPAVSATAGDFIYVASETTGFNSFFGFAPNYTDSSAPSVNGDDAIELFQNGTVVDVFGDINTDGTGEPWEYLDGWAYRVDGTGPDGTTFTLANWSFSGPNALDGETDNATAATPFPVGSYSPPAGDTAPTVSSTTPADSATDVALDADISINFSEDVTVSGAWFSINCASSGAHTAVVSGGPQNYTLDPATDFSNGEVCTVTIVATQVTDQDGTPDTMTADYVWSFTTTTGVPSSIVINEILADPASGLAGDANGDGTRDSSDDEFVELVNTSDNDVDISGWILSDAVGLRHIFPAGTIIPAHCGIVVFGGGTPTGTFGGVIVQTASGGYLSLNNSGDSVTLNDGAADQDTMTYGAEGGEDQSLTRDPDITGSFVRHSTATGSGGTLFSPGTKIDGSQFAGCTISDTPPTVSSTTPANGATDVALDADISVEFSEDVTVSGAWFSINCASSGLHTATVSGGPQDYVLNPDADFVANDECTVTVFAAQVADTDTDDPPDNMAADYVFSFTTVAPPFGVCGDPATFIHKIQGSGMSSPEDGKIHVIEGVVVGDFQTGAHLRGFFLQEENADTDGDPHTSEGIFVYDGSFPSMDVNVGDIVRVKGTVDEFHDLTELTSIINIEICSSGGVASAAMITLPVTSVNDWEWYEGMLVNISGPLYATGNYSQGQYGEVDLSVGNRLDQPTNVVEPGAPAIALQDFNDRSRIQLEDGRTSSNPVPVPYIGDGGTLRAGDTIPELTGVLNYAYSTYEVHPTGAVSFTRVNTRDATPPDVGGTLKVASFNVLNYFFTIDPDPSDDSSSTPDNPADNICGPAANMECRGADSVEEFTRQRDKIISAIVTMDADVIGLMEMENHPTDAALQDLVNGLNDAAGPGTYAYVNTGPVGTDAIKVAFVYKPGVVTPDGAYAILDSLVDPTFNDQRNRPALAQTFQENASGEKFTVAVNHLKSKGTPCTDPLIDNPLDPDTGDGQGNCNQTRTAAANALVNWLVTDPTGSGDDDVLIMGDLNAYAKEDPIDAIKVGGYTNLVETFVGADAYSYVYYGQAGYLDHALATSTLTAQVTDVTEWHINTDEPAVLDYNDYNQPAGLYNPDQYRASDHDPVIVGLSLLSSGDVSISKAQSAGATVLPGETFFYELTIQNTYNGMVDMLITDALSEHLDYVGGSLKVGKDGGPLIGEDDMYMTGDILNYKTDMTGINLLTIIFEVKVSDLVDIGALIINQAFVQVFYAGTDILIDDATSNTVQTKVVPEPATVFFLGIGLLGLFALARRKRRQKK